MNRESLVVAVVVSAGGTAAFAGGLPNTMNFRNVTSQRIIQTNPEAANNEKEVEHGDFDNDGDLDVMIAVAYSDFGQRDNKLYRNDPVMGGGYEFTEISATVPLFTTNMGDVARNAFFRDYNQDGWLDMIVVCDNNTGGDPGRTKLWINVNDGVSHLGWSEEGNVRLGSSTGGAACGAVSIDADGVNGPDLYVGNYPGPSQDTLYLNNGAAFFTEVTGTNVPADSDYTVDVASADMNGDGKLDLLVSNGFSDFNWIYYNDNLGAGSGAGDYRYTGSQQQLGSAAASENSMEPGDFDNDDDMDFYWSNRSGVTDMIMVNQGNDAANKAVLATLSNLPQSVTTVTSRKATVADLNEDGRVDVFVMKETNSNARPTLLRNTTVFGQITFVDWTPYAAFPTGTTHKGWHADVFDADGDGDLDVFLGGWANDHLFEQVDTPTHDEADLVDGVVPSVFNLNATAVTGAAGVGESDTFVIEGLTSTAFLSVVLNGPDDYMVEILDGADTVLATVNRGPAGTEEATQYDPVSMPSTAKVRVTVNACGNTFDLDGDCGVGILDFLDLLAAWGPNPGHPADYNGDDVVGIVDFLDLLANWGGPEDYVLELLARDG